MKYKKMVEAKFIERPNRFVAYCDIDGQIEKVHVKNTGKCKELLVPGYTVYLEESDNLNRQTKYSLIAVKKRNRLINMDSQVTNKMVYESLENKSLVLPGFDEEITLIKPEKTYGNSRFDGLINMDSQVTNKMVYESLENKSLVLPGFDEEITLIKPEKTYGNSRFDVYIEGKTKKAFIEVKGCTLEIDGVIKFPDAKTERGVKHVRELIEARKDGYLAYIIFVIQMDDVLYFTPNIEMHKEFGDVLKEAEESGVNILAYDSLVEIDNIKLNKPVKVILDDTNSK